MACLDIGRLEDELRQLSTTGFVNLVLELRTDRDVFNDIIMGPPWSSTKVQVERFIDVFESHGITLGPKANAETVRDALVVVMAEAVERRHSA